jgi:hypothetical protein
MASWVAHWGRWWGPGARRDGDVGGQEGLLLEEPLVNEETYGER